MKKSRLKLLILSIMYLQLLLVSRVTPGAQAPNLGGFTQLRFTSHPLRDSSSEWRRAGLVTETLVQTLAMGPTRAHTSRVTEAGEGETAACSQALKTLPGNNAHCLAFFPQARGTQPSSFRGDGAVHLWCAWKHKRWNS